MSDLVGTPEQVAEQLEVDANFVRDLIRRNEIPHVRLGPRKVIIPWAALSTWLDERALSSLAHGGTAPDLGLVADTS